MGSLGSRRGNVPKVLGSAPLWLTKSIGLGLEQELVIKKSSEEGKVGQCLDKKRRIALV